MIVEWSFDGVNRETLEVDDGCTWHWIAEEILDTFDMNRHADELPTHFFIHPPEGPMITVDIRTEWEPRHWTEIRK